MDQSSTAVGDRRRVRPTDDGLWEVDLRDEGGPVLGPFETRGEAGQALTEFWAEEQ